MAWMLAAGAMGASALSSALGFSADKKAYNAYNKEFKRGSQNLLTGMNLSNQDWTKSEGLLKGLMPLIDKGYGQARGDLSMAGNNARRTLLDREKQSNASLTQSLTSRGLYGTTALEGAQRGIMSDTSRALASVDENLGQLLAGLRTEQTGAQVGAQSALANFYPQRAATDMANRTQYTNYRMGIPIKPAWETYAAQHFDKAGEMAAYGWGKKA